MKYLLSIFLSFACLPVLVNATPGEVPVGDILLDLPMQGLTGSSMKLSAYRGKPLVINVWASYCSPCLAEMASLERLKQRNTKYLNVIGISIDDYADRANAFLQKANTTFPHYIDYQLKLENMLGANTIPLTLFIDEQGRVLHKVRGARDWDSPDITRAIDKMFKINP